MISITAPNSFKYNQITVSITAENVPEDVTLSGVSFTDGTITKNISSGNYSYSNGVITVGLGVEDLPISWDNKSITINTAWSNAVTAADESTCLVTTRWATEEEADTGDAPYYPNEDQPVIGSDDTWYGCIMGITAQVIVTAIKINNTSVSLASEYISHWAANQAIEYSLDYPLFTQGQAIIYIEFSDGTVIHTPTYTVE